MQFVVYSEVYRDAECVVNANANNVFCSNSCAFAEPVAGLALPERFTERSRNPSSFARRSSRGTT